MDAKVRPTDARKLSQTSQEDLRRRVVAAIEAGQKEVETAATFGVSQRSVSRWWSEFGRAGNEGLAAGKRGRRPEEQKALSASQQARLKKAVAGQYPDQVELPGLVWTRGQLAGLVDQWFGMVLSRVTIAEYLRSWGLPPQRPIRAGDEHNPEAVEQWLETDYPAIAARAKQEKAVILWLNQTGTTWAPKAGRRTAANAICAVSDKGELYFTVFHGSYTAVKLIEFYDRLVRQLDRKIHLITEGLPAQRAVLLKKWLAKRPDQIEPHFLPSS
jgi:transposase